MRIISLHILAILTVAYLLVYGGFQNVMVSHNLVLQSNYLLLRKEIEKVKKKKEREQSAERPCPAQTGVSGGQPKLCFRWAGKFCFKENLRHQ